MADIRELFTTSELDINEIYKVLFDGISVKKDKIHDNVMIGEEFSCSVLYNPNGIEEQSGFLTIPENLNVSFSFKGSLVGYKTTIQIVMNWLKNTNSDAVLANNFDYVILQRIEKQLVINTYKFVWLPEEILELINIPYEKTNLGAN